MANSKTTLWLWRPTPTDPTAKLGFYTVLKTAAQALVDGQFAQWPKIGAYRFKRIDKEGTSIALEVTAQTPSVVEGGDITYRIFLSTPVNAPVVINTTAAPSSTAVAGVDYIELPDNITIPANGFYDLVVETIDRAGVEGPRTLVLQVESNHSSIYGTPTATATITDGA